MGSLGPTSSAVELAAALRARELSAVELLDACLAAVDARNPELNAVVWRDDEAARAAARDADARIAAGEEAPFLGVPIPIKDLTAVAGWPVTYGSNGAAEELERGERARRRGAAAGRLRPLRPHQHARVRPDHRGRELALRQHRQPLGHGPRLGRLLRRRLGGGRRRDVPDRPRQRRRRLDPHPRRLHAAWSA